MTYEKFIAASKAGQLRYIREERKRYERARKLFWRYRAAMGKLGLHALSLNEIADRFDELKRMEATVDETHGDTERMRVIYESGIWKRHGRRSQNAA